MKEDEEGAYFSSPEAEGPSGDRSKSTPVKPLQFPKLDEFSDEREDLFLTLKTEREFEKRERGIWRHFLILKFLKSETSGAEKAGAPSPRRHPSSSLAEYISVPWKVEKTLWFGTLMCLETVLYEVTLMPISALIALAKLVLRREPSSKELSDLVRLSLLVSLVVFFSLTIDFSLLYHYLRAQSLLKLYFIFNMMEILERLVRSWGCDMLDGLVQRVRRSAMEESENSFEGRLLNPVAISWVSTFLFNCVHAHMHFWRILLISVALVSGDASMFMIVVTNNLAEIKSTVFKKFDLKSLYPVAASDVVERLYLLFDVGLILFSLFTSPQKRRMPLNDVLFWIGVMLVIEVLTDWIKFLCVAKFNSLSNAMTEFHRIQASDVVNVREDSLVAFGHGATRRFNFQALPISALVIFHIFSPVLAGTDATVLWIYRANVWLCLLAAKLLISVFLLGHALSVGPPKTSANFKAL